MLTSRRPDPITLAAFAATVVIGGANSIAVRISLRELTPFWGATLRFALASVVLACVVIAFRRPIPTRENVVGIVLFGVLNFGLTYVFLYTGLRSAPAGTASVITALVPLLTVVFTVIHGVERFRPAGLVGSLIAATGIALVFRDQASLNVPIPALLALVGAAACLAESSVLVKRFPPGDPIAAMAIAVPIGATLLAILSLLSGEPWIIPARLETWLAQAYLVVVASIVGFSLILYVLARWTASANSYGFLMSPLVTVVLGGIVLGETVQPAFVIGGALVLAGVYVAVVLRSRPAPPAADGQPLLLPEEP